MITSLDFSTGREASGREGREEKQGVEELQARRALSPTTSGSSMMGT